MINQRHIRNLIFETIADAKLSNDDNIVCYIKENETLYQTKTSPTLVSDDKYIIDTNVGVNTKWVGISGKYTIFNNDGIIESRNPNNTDDGLSIGTTWYNSSNHTYWICSDNSPANSIWTIINREFITPIDGTTNDLPNILAYATSQLSQQHPIYLYDPLGIGFVIEGVDNNPSISYNELDWIGINNPKITIGGTSNVIFNMHGVDVDIKDDSTTNISSNIKFNTLTFLGGSQNVEFNMLNNSFYIHSIIQIDRSPNTISVTSTNSNININNVDGLQELLLRSNTFAKIVSINNSVVRLGVDNNDINIHLSWGNSSTTQINVFGVYINIFGSSSTIDINNDANYVNIFGNNIISNINGITNISNKLITNDDNDGMMVINSTNISINSINDPTNFIDIKSNGSDRLLLSNAGDVSFPGMLYFNGKIKGNYHTHQPANLTPYNIDLSLSRNHLLDLTSTDTGAVINPSIDISLSNGSSGDEYTILVKIGADEITTNYIGNTFLSVVSSVFTTNNYYMLDKLLVADNNNVLIVRNEFPTGSSS